MFLREDVTLSLILHYGSFLDPRNSYLHPLFFVIPFAVTRASCRQSKNLQMLPNLFGFDVLLPFLLSFSHRLVGPFVFFQCSWLF